MTETKKTSAVDIDMLTMALQAGDLDAGWWLDTHSGEVIPQPDAKGSKAERATIASRQSLPDRYIDIEPLADSIMLELMESFVATIEDEIFCQGLSQALVHKQAAWRFKGALAKDPAHEDSWYAFKEQFYALQARQWARDQGLDYESVTIAEVTSRNLPTMSENAGRALLQLHVPLSSGYRRYEVWRASNDDAIALTAYAADHPTGEQVIAECSLSDQQLQGLNPILAQIAVDITAQIDGQPAQHTDEAHSKLSIRQPECQVEINGALTAGSVSYQLLTLFNVLLGLTD